MCNKGAPGGWQGLGSTAMLMVTKRLEGSEGRVGAELTAVPEGRGGGGVHKTCRVGGWAGEFFATGQ